MTTAEIENYEKMQNDYKKLLSEYDEIKSNKNDDTVDKRKAAEKYVQDVFIDTPTEQIRILKNKNCDCKFK